MLVLDVGCGFAEQTNEKRTKYAARPHGDVNIDIKRPTVKIKNFIRADAHQLPMRDNCFDMIYAFHLIEHLEKPSFFLMEAKRALKDGGVIEIIVPSIYYKGTYKDPNHKWFFNAKLLRELVKRYFQIFKIQGCGGVWFPMRARKLLFVKLNFERFLPPDLCATYRVICINKGN